MSACGSSFSASCCCSIFSFLFLFIFVRVVFPTTLDYARKIGNPGPHYSTVLFFFLSPFSRVRLASDPSCSGLRLRRFRLGPTAPVRYINGMTKSRSFIAILSADRLRNRILIERCDEISHYLVVHVIIREMKGFQFPFFYKIFKDLSIRIRVSKNLYKFKIDIIYKFQ